MRFFRLRKRGFERRVPPSQPRWGVQHRRSRFLRISQLLQGKFLLLLLIVSLAGGIVYGVFFTRFLHIRDVSTSSENKDVNVDRLQQALIERVIDEHLFLISLREIEREMYDRFPDIASLDCSRELLTRSISCYAQGFELVAVIKHQEKRYYINENGVVIGFDNRKLGLPIFDLILNPIYAGVEAKADQATTPAMQGPVVPASSPVAAETPPPGSPTPVNAPTVAPTTPAASPTTPEEKPPVEEAGIAFISPTQEPPVLPLVLEEERKVFEVTVGKQILDPKELKSILVAIQELEKVLHRKVIEALYVQVAGELSLRSKPALAEESPPEDGEASDEAIEVPPTPAEPDESAESPDHEFTILLDLRRSLDDQLRKLERSKEVIDFSRVIKIDLSIDGDKVFYREAG